MAFYVVYIREAHPSNGWQVTSNIKDNVVFASPQSFEERSGVARMCVVKLGIEFPALIDNFDNPTETAYTGWPDRLYVIDRSGRVAYKSKAGPFGFHPDEMAQALAKIVPPGNPLKQTH